jgi:hypothetical protein
MVSSAQFIQQNSTASATAWCNHGDRLISGGYTFDLWGPLDFHVLVDWPSFDEQSWQAGGYNGSDWDITITAYAICADMTP